MPGGPLGKPKKVAGGEGKKAGATSTASPKASKSAGDEDGNYIVGDDDKPYGEPVREDHQDPLDHRKQQDGSGKADTGHEYRARSYCPEAMWSLK